MVKVGIIADTHITKDNFKNIGQKLLTNLNKAFKNVDEIIHAGDINSKFFMDELNKISIVKAVSGEDDLIELDTFIKFNIRSYQIGVIHKKPIDVKNFSRTHKLHILIFGHTHQPLIQGTNHNTLIINPGSPTFPKAPPQKRGFDKPVPRPSVVLLMIDEDDILSTYLINI